MSYWDGLVDWEVDGVDENSHLREGKGIKFWLRCKMVCGFEVCLDVFLDVCLNVYSFLLSAVCFLLSAEFLPSSSFFVQSCIRCYCIEERATIVIISIPHFLNMDIAPGQKYVRSRVHTRS